MKAKAKKPTTQHAVIDRAETRAKAKPKPARRPSVATARNIPKPEEAPVLKPGKAPDWDVAPPLVLRTGGDPTPEAVERTVSSQHARLAPDVDPAEPIPDAIAAALYAAAALALPVREYPDTAPAYDTIESCSGVVGAALEAAAHEKAMIDEILYHLERRKKELQEELTLTLQACGLEATPVSVRGCVVRYFTSHTSRLDKGELLKRGVGAEIIEASTIRAEYSYAKVVVPGSERAKGAAA